MSDIPGSPKKEVEDTQTDSIETPKAEAPETAQTTPEPGPKDAEQHSRKPSNDDSDKETVCSAS